MSKLREELYTAVDALIVRESMLNNVVQDYSQIDQHLAVEYILDILMDLFEQ